MLIHHSDETEVFMIFIRPWFLLLLLVIPLFFHLKKRSLNNNPWKKIINPEFLPFLIIKQNKTKKGNLFFIWISLLWAILSIALAGPAFEKAPTSVNKNEQGTVLIVDLNSVNPTTLTQLKIKLSETVKQLKAERIGLVLYDEKGYIALPMTEDKQIIQEMIPILDPSVLPAMGNKTHEGFKTAINLLKNNNLETGRILFFTGGIPSEKETLSLLKDYKYSIGILGLGNGEKTPLLLPNGQFRRDNQGNIILTQLNQKALSKLGALELWQPTHSDIESLIKKTNPSQNPSLFTKTQDLLFTVDTYKDVGIYLLLLLMPFVALFYRKGFFILIFLLCSTVSEASLWLRDDQILYNSNEKAVQAYKNKDYLSALAGFKNDTSDMGLYNQGNATAYMGRYQEAIDLYKQALQKNPNHKEARFNKEYLESMMKNNQSSSQQNQKNNSQNQSNTGENNTQTSEQNSNSSQEKDSKNTDNSEQNNDEKNTSSSQDNESGENQETKNNSNSSASEENKTPSAPLNSDTSNTDKNEQIYPPEKEENTSLKEEEKTTPQEKQNEKNENNNEGTYLEESQNENPIDQTSQEIFNRLKKDPSRLLRYRLYEQNRRIP